MLKTNHESNACLLLETNLRWLLWRLGLLGRALKLGLWPVMVYCREQKAPRGGRLSNPAAQRAAQGLSVRTLERGGDLDVADFLSGSQQDRIK